MLFKLMTNEADHFIQDVLNKIISLYKLSKVNLQKLETYMDLIGMIMESEYEYYNHIKKTRVICFALLVE
jgi:hypothetical protein